ncbi:MAG: twin-arginine translocase subunit TatC [bacterium]|nr:twin-arginine translocase subunit TatC [bacterium]
MPNENSEIGKEQTFLEHLEDLRKMILNCIFPIVALSPIGFYLAPKLINFLMTNSLPNSAAKFHYFSPMEVFIVQLKTGIVISFILCFPIIVKEVKKFILPALYKDEKKFLTFLIVSSSILFLLGVFCCIFLILPLIMKFSFSFSNAHLEQTIGISNFINLAAGLILAFGLMFQFPLAIIVLIKIGLVELETIQKLRPYVIVVILILSALLTPPDIASQVMLAIPTYLLFEIGLLLAKII